MAAKKKETGKGLYKKRYATLKEHRAAVAARKALKGGKNVGPVANPDAYGEQIKKKKQPVTKPAEIKPAVKSTTKPSAQANKGTGRDGKFGTGTYGKGRPSDSKTTPKSKPVSETERRRRARRSNRGGARNATVNAMDAFKSAVKFVDTKLRLTHKKGDVKKVGNKTYRWDGKKWQLLNRPF